MKDDFMYLIHLAAGQALGLQTKPPFKGINWNNVLAFADEQMLSALVFLAIRNNDSMQLKKEQYLRLEKEAWGEMVRNRIKRETVTQLMDEAAKKGLSPCIIKGIAIADCYKVPEARFSLDTDVYIDETEEERMLKFLETKCLAVKPRERSMHHSECIHPECGVLELHTSLFSRQAKTIWLQNSKLIDKSLKQLVRIHSENGDYYTLNQTEHFIYICFHFLNHFVNMGVSVQMCIDIAVYYCKNKQKINRQKVEKELISCRAAKLIMSVFEVLKLSGIPQEYDLCSDLPIDDQAVSLLISDLKSGCKSEQEELLNRELDRKENLEKKVFSQYGKSKYIKLQFWYYLRQMRRYLFPNAKELQTEFPKDILLIAFYKHIAVKISKYCARNQNVIGIQSNRENIRKNLLEIMGLM